MDITTVLILGLTVITGMALGFAFYTLHQTLARIDSMTLRGQVMWETSLFALAKFAETSLLQMKAKSVAEAVGAEAERQAYDVRVQMLRDTYAKEASNVKQREAELEPKKVRTFDGREFLENEIEVLS